MSKKVRFSIGLSVDTLKLVDKTAKEEMRSRSNMVEKIIEHHYGLDNPFRDALEAVVYKPRKIITVQEEQTEEFKQPVEFESI